MRSPWWGPDPAPLLLPTRAFPRYTLPMALNFWDFQSDLQKQAAPARAPKANQPLTVSQLTAVIEKALRAGVPSLLAVRGEISNYKPHAGSGHHYFTLKDATSCIDCVMFRDEATTLRFKPVVGMELIATGRVGVYSIKG